MKKALAIFAASSVFATGVSLASNVSLGHKMTAFLSEAFEFVGPVSGLVNALVKHADIPKNRVIPSFQDNLPSPAQGSSPAPTGNPSKPLRGAELVQSPTLAAAGSENTVRSAEAVERGYSNSPSHTYNGSAAPAHLGSVAQAITENGDSSVLANLGKSLQGKFQDPGTNGSERDVWASLLNKPELAPAKLALHSVRSNKQEDAGTRIAQSITSEDLSQNASNTAANILSEATADQGTASSGRADSSTASQMTRNALAQTSPASPGSGKVPLPGGIQLILIGALAFGGLRLGKGIK